MKKELERVRAEVRAAICAANDVEQYGRRNNIRIRGLIVDEGNDCRAAHDKCERWLEQFDTDNESVVPPSNPGKGHHCVWVFLIWHTS